MLFIAILEIQLIRNYTSSAEKEVVWMQYQINGQKSKTTDLFWWQVYKIQRFSEK